MPFTLRTTFCAAVLTVLPNFPPLAGVEAFPVVFALEAGIRALTGLFVGAFLAAGLRGDFVSVFVALAGVRDRPPLAAAAIICFLVSADGRLSGDDLAGDAGAALDPVFREGIRTPVLAFVAFLTVGSLAFFAAGLAPPRAVVAPAVLEDVFPRAVVAFDTAFLTPALMDFGVSNLRFLP